MNNAIEMKMAEIKAKALQKKENNLLAKLDDPKYQERLMAQVVKEEDFNNLTSLEATFKEIVELNPIPRSSDGVNRKWSNRYIYGIGESARILINLLNGLRYAAAPHRELMQVELPVSTALAAEVIDSIGSFSYFNTRLGIVVEGQKANADKVAEMLELIGTLLNMDIDTSKLTQSSMDKLEAKAFAEANTNKLAWEEAIRISSLNGANFVM